MRNRERGEKERETNREGDGRWKRSTLVNAQLTQVQDSYFEWLQQRTTIFWFGASDANLRIESFGGLIQLVEYLKNRLDEPRTQLCASIMNHPESVWRRDLDHQHVSIPNVRKATHTHILGLTPVTDARFVLHLAQDVTEDKYADCAGPAVELAFAAWTMVDFGTRSAGLSPCIWSPDEGLNEAVARYMPRIDDGENKFKIYHIAPAAVPPNANDADRPPDHPPRLAFAVVQDDPVDTDCDLEFPDYFTLYHMHRMSGFSIKWVDNLLDHLRLRKGHDPETAHFVTTVYVFHQVTALAGIAQG